MSDPIRNEMVALFRDASPEIQRKLNQLLDIYREKQLKLYNMLSESKIYRRRGTVHFGLLGYLCGLRIDKKTNSTSENLPSFEPLLRSVKVGFDDLKRKLDSGKQADSETIVFQHKQYENVLALIECETAQLSKEIIVHETAQQKSGVCEHLVDSSEQELKGFSYICGLFGLKTESKRLQNLREQLQDAEEQDKINSYEQNKARSR